jgi:hypothetical protein
LKKKKEKKVKKRKKKRAEGRGVAAQGECKMQNTKYKMM